MRFRIKFDKDLFLEQTKITLPFVYSFIYKKVKNYFVLTLVLTVVGIIILMADSELSTLFFVCAIFSSFFLYIHYENYTGVKNDHMRRAREITKLIDLEHYSTFEFRPECLRIIGETFCTWINWEDFKKFRVVDSNILLIHKDIQQEIFVIGESEVGEDGFKRIVEFVGQKID